MVTAISFKLPIVNSVSVEERCPYLRIKGEQIYCGKGKEKALLTPEREAACDSASLRLYCLNPSNHRGCSAYCGRYTFEDSEERSR